MPRGPVEIGPIWFAGSRLAYSTCGIKVWGAGQHNNGEWFIYVSRVVDKSCRYSMSILIDVLGRLNFEGVTDVTIWSDAGTHFRSYQMMGTICKHVMETYRCNFQLNYGLEKHFKNVCDGNSHRNSAAEIKTPSYTKGSPTHSTQMQVRFIPSGYASNACSVAAGG